MTMTKKQKDWQQLHEFISWEYYESLDRAELECLCQDLKIRTDSIWAQMDQTEIIYHRTQRFRAVANAQHLLRRLQEILQQTSKAPTHTHQL